MAELSVGDRVELTAPDLLLDDGSIVFEGARGRIVGFKGGFGHAVQAIVSFEPGPPYRTGLVRTNDVVRRGGS